MNVSTRTAPAGARLTGGLGNPGKAHAAQIVLRCNAAGQSDMAMGFIRQNASLAAVDAALADAPDQADTLPDTPNTPPDTAARLDAQQAQLTDHEARIAGLELRSPPPVVPDSGSADGASAASAAAAARTAPSIVSSGAIYARMNARPGEPKAAVSTTPMPAPVQIGARLTLDGSAINARHRALCAARVGHR